MFGHAPASLARFGGRMLTTHSSVSTNQSYRSLFQIEDKDINCNPCSIRPWGPAAPGPLAEEVAGFMSAVGTQRFSWQI